METQQHTKRFLSLFIVILLVVSQFTAIPVFAAEGDITGTYDGLKWTVDVSGNLINVEAGDRTVSGIIDIPVSVVDDDTGTERSIINLGNPVIASNTLFYNNTTITKVIIPEGVESILDGSATTSGVFNGCSGLIEAVLPSTLVFIGGSAFRNCTTLEILTLPPNLESIGIQAFNNCAKINVTIPNGLTFLGGNSFYGCAGLQTIVIPEGIINLLAYTFQNCTGLTDVILPQGLQSIGNNTFNGCTKLTTVNLSGSPQNSIGTVVFPDSIVSIGDSAFFNTAIVEVLFPNVSVTFDANVFANCPNLEAVLLPGDGSTSPTAFFNYTTTPNLKAVNLQPGATEIWNWAFGGSAIESYVVPETVTKIGANAFQNCGSLTTITLHNGIESFGGNNIFSGSGLTSFTFPINDNLKTIPNTMFNNTKITELTIPANIQNIGGNFVQNCTQLEIINCPESITFTSAIIFNNCSSLKNLVFPHSTTNVALGADAFANCAALTEITLPAYINSIPSNGLRNANFTKITILNPNIAIGHATNAIGAFKNTVTYYIPRGTTASNSLNDRLIPQGHKYKYLDVTVSVSANDGAGVDFVDKNLNVSYDSAAKYGFAKSAYASEITALDVLVAAHVVKYGWTSKTDATQLVIDSNGSVIKAFGSEVSDYHFTVNGVKITDNLGSAIICETLTASGGVAADFSPKNIQFHSASASSVFAQIKIKGAAYKHEISLIPDFEHTLILVDLNGNPINDIPVWCNDPVTGEFTTYLGFTDANGEIKVIFNEEGQFLLLARDLDQGKIICEVLTVNVHAPNNRINITGVTGNPSFNTASALSSGYTAGTFVKKDENGLLTTGFSPTHHEYNLYVNNDINSVIFTIAASDSSANPLLSVSAGSANIATDIPATVGVWTQTVTLTGIETEVTFAVKCEDNGVPYTRTYIVNVVKEGNTPFAGIVNAVASGGTYLYSGKYKTGASSLTLLVHKHQPTAEIEVTVMSGTELYVDDVKQTNIKSTTGVSDVYLVELNVSGLVYNETHGTTTTRVLSTKRNDDGQETSKAVTVKFLLRSPVDGVYTVDEFVNINLQRGQFAFEEMGSTPLLGYTYYNKWVSLGGYGGYATYYFKDAIKHNPNNPYGLDFIIYGNSFQGGAPNEPAGVQVSFDGIEWYDLAGQRHYELTTHRETGVILKNFSTTESLMIARSNFEGYGVGYPQKVNWGYADVASCSIMANAQKYWSVDGKPFNPYRQNIFGSGGNIGDMMSLLWAVDKNGKPIDLSEKLKDGIHYIRVQNVVDVSNNGAFGEISPEIGTITLINPALVDKTKEVSITKKPEVLTINGISVFDFIKPENVTNGGRTTYIDFDLSKNGSIAKVVVEGAATDNIFVNMEAYYGGKAEYDGLLASQSQVARGTIATVKEESSRMIRVLVQNGDQEPRIYVINCTNGGDPDKNADLVSITLVPGDVLLTKNAAGNYVTTVENNVQRIDLTIHALNPETTIKLDGVEIKHGIASSYLDVNEGENNFTVTITSKDNSVTNTYPIVITRKTSTGSTDPNTNPGTDPGTNPGTDPGTDPGKPPESNNIKVTFTFTGDIIHYGTGNSHQSATWIAKTTVDVPVGSTAKYLTDMMLMNAGIEFKATFGGGYIAGVKIPAGFTGAGQWLEEFTNGPNSGWMYRVDGVIVNKGYSSWVLQNGQDVVWFYTDDYTNESGYDGNWGNNIPGGDNTDPGGDTPSVTPGESGYSAALKKVLGYLKTTVTAPNMGSVGGEWAVLALARGGYTNTAYYDGYYSRILTEIAGKTKLDANKSTENSRVILALTALGIDAGGAGGSDLISALSDKAWVSRQGINGPIFALIALDTKPYEASGTLRQDLAEYIVGKEIAGGGWSLGGSANVDITAMAIQALAPYMGQSEVSAAVNRGLAWLYGQRVWDAEGNAQVIVALSALGIDAAAYVDALLTYYNAATGAFTRGGQDDLMATEQSAYALVAYDRYKNGKNSLYDMSDAARLISGGAISPAEADKSALKAEITKADALTQANYTGASWANMQTVLTAAKAVYDRPEATQRAVDDATNALSAALANLKTAAANPGTPGQAEPSEPSKRYATIMVADPGAKEGRRQIYKNTTKIEITDGETAYSLLQKTGLDLRVSTHSQYAGVYVEAIDGFGEFDDGPASGWMYSVNGKFPNYSSSLYYLEDGDVVRWLYTRDLGSDINGSWNPSGPNEAPNGGIFGGSDSTPTGGGKDGTASGGGTPDGGAAVKDGTATAEVKADEIKELVAKAKEEKKTNVTLEITGTKNADTIELELTVGSISEITKNGMSLTVQTENGTVIFDAESLKSIAAGKKSDEKVRIVIKEAKPESLTQKQQAKANGKPVYELSVWVGDTQIHDFKGTVSIKLPKIPEGTKPEDYDLLTVYHMDGDGNIKEMKGAKYDPETRMMTFTTDHFSMFFVSEWINPFADVEKTDWYYRSVRYVYGGSLMVGVSADAFAPATELTRAMLVTILWRHEGEPKAALGAAFTDVAAGKWYSEAIAWASENGIVKGYGDGRFGVDDTVTREQIAVILYRYASYKGNDVSAVDNLAKFDDAEKISEWAIQAMKWAHANGLVNGRTLSTLVPEGNATRAEAATLLMRFIENIAQ